MLEPVSPFVDEKGVYVGAPKDAGENPLHHPAMQAFMREMMKATARQPRVGKTERSLVPAVGAKKAKPKFVKKGRGSEYSLTKRIGKVTIADGVQAGVKAWSFIRKYLNVETKMFDVSQTAQAITYSGLVQSLSNVAEGSDYLNRSGNSILAQRLNLRFQVFGNENVGQAMTNPTVRLMVLRDMLYTSGTDPTPAQILEVTATAQAVYSPFLHIHDGNPAAKRFRVLMDKTISIVFPYATTIATTGTGVVDTLGSVSHFQEVDMHVGAHVEFQSTAGTDAAAWVGHLYFFQISNIQTNGPLVAWYSRMYFTDN